MAYDAVIVGGSFAGLSAALPLARARRRVAVVDGGVRRNRFADHSYNFFGQDGAAPSEMVATAKQQLLRYSTVLWLDDVVEAAEREGDAFALRTSGGHWLRAQRLVLASGVVDHLPAVPGLRERWGRSVFHCPYCHGYELDGGRIGVLATGPMSVHQALLLPEWGSVTFFLNGAASPDEAQRQELAARGVRIEPTPVRALAGEATVVLDDGREVELAGLFTASRTEPASPLARQLGCAFEDGPLGPFVKTDAQKATTVAGVFACGDMARGAGSVALAVGDGAMAGTAAHRSLVFPA
ncbi:NAD(P)/FAD-dependent oxidoreductase [Ramlibacter tataouinensis]|uniref:Thioredoxin-disulfide reductase-like protein n=1 Tax=Ramlibacter tataouinensis (strain ATCC BAA-407 / DSM 14655 / LMG 21543 / TTB310) TaxID=365046 RepID=F5Y367_RAMTT|nr:NAD(P)/FAD-dependent oxidoreductase [Ramlibacter tataouinensis]AEG91154.1 thioredoxin-disulfide reductase-like protein [Ramlibacter tataouinensis TTB310]